MRKYTTKDGVVIVDNRDTLEEWVKAVGGKFAKLVELAMAPTVEGGTPELFALIRTDTAWEPIRYKVPPEDVTVTIPQIQEAFKNIEKAVAQIKVDENPDELPF